MSVCVRVHHISFLFISSLASVFVFVFVFNALLSDDSTSPRRKNNNKHKKNTNKLCFPCVFFFSVSSVKTLKNIVIKIFLLNAGSD